MYTGYCNKVLANTAETLSLKSKFYESRGHIWPASAVFPVPSTVLAHSKWTVRNCPINKWWMKMWCCIDINQCDNKSFVNLRSGRFIEGMIVRKLNLKRAPQNFQLIHTSLGEGKSLSSWQRQWLWEQPLNSHSVFICSPCAVPLLPKLSSQFKRSCADIKKWEI